MVFTRVQYSDLHCLAQYSNHCLLFSVILESLVFFFLCEFTVIMKNVFFPNAFFFTIDYVHLINICLRYFLPPQKFNHWIPHVYLTIIYRSFLLNTTEIIKNFLIQISDIISAGQRIFIQTVAVLSESSAAASHVFPDHLSRSSSFHASRTN